MADHPPTPDSYTNIIELTSITDSKITAVSLYSSRAEITRVFKIQLKTGQNRVNINGLPDVIQNDTVRLEGRGPATIHDVSVATMPERQKPATSQALETLMSRQERTVKALERCAEMHGAIGKYLATLHVQNITIDNLDKIVQGYDATCERLDNKILDLEKQLKLIGDEIQKEKQVGTDTDQRDWLRKKVSLSLFAERESQVELTLIYAVTNASWTALYDIRVDMQKKETPITLIYKAVVTQNTAEDWEDVHLTLETATPTYQVALPSLRPWTLSFHRPVVVVQSRRTSIRPKLFRGPQLSRGPQSESEYTSDILSSDHSLSEMPIQSPHTTVTSKKGNISATFGIPGIITIPSDATAHNVTITELKLDGTMSWVVVPKLDAKTRLSAKIKNESEFTLLSGTASIYVDGSFISKSTIPAVSPGESFDCALGLDPAIRISYLPLSKKSTRTGFYAKTNVTSYTQRISIQNTKSIPITNLRIVDHIPVSSEEKIVVKLISPALRNVRADADTPGKTRNTIGNTMTVSPGVTAQWGNGTDDAVTGEEDTAAVGHDGRLYWICEVPPQGKINLALQWEVSAPAEAAVVEH